MLFRYVLAEYEPDRVSEPIYRRLRRSPHPGLLVQQARLCSRLLSLELAQAAPQLPVPWEGQRPKRPKPLPRISGCFRCLCARRASLPRRAPCLRSEDRNALQSICLASWALAWRAWTESGGCWPLGWLICGAVRARHFARAAATWGKKLRQSAVRARPPAAESSQTRTRATLPRLACQGAHGTRTLP